MDISALIKAVATLPSERDTLLIETLAPGDRLNGKVVRVEPHGRAILDLGGARIKAQIAFPVQKGDVLRMAVVENGPQLHLRALDAPAVERPSVAPESFGQVLSPEQQKAWDAMVARILAEPVAGGDANAPLRAMQAALARIRHAFQPLSVDRPVAEIALQLRDLFQNHGALFEKKLADVMTATRLQSHTRDGSASDTPLRAVLAQDLKPHLLQLKSLLSEPALPLEAAGRLTAEERALMNDTVSRFLSRIEQFQEHAALRRTRQDDHQLFGHTVTIEGQEHPVHFKLYYPKRNSGEAGQRQHRVAILLQLDALGMVRVDIAAVERHLHINFYVDRESTRDVLKKESDHVRHALAGHFESVHINVLSSREKVRHFHTEDDDTQGAARIDLKA